MKRITLAGVLIAGAAALMAQQRPQAGAPPAAAAPAAAPAAPAGPAPKSAEEAKAIQAIVVAQQAGNMDGVISAAENLLTSFADTQFKELALTLEAGAYEAKGNNDRAEIQWGRVLQVNPKSVQGNLSLAELILKRTGEKDLHRDEKLAQAQKYLDTVLDAVKNGPKPNPQISDADWAAMGQSFNAQVHNDFGTMAIIRAGANKDDAKKYWDQAVSEYQTAVNQDPSQVAYQAKLASALFSSGKNAEAVALCDKILATPNLHPQIKSFVDRVRAGASQAPAAK